MTKRRRFLQKLGLGFVAITATDILGLFRSLFFRKPGSKVHFTTGYKVSEVTSDRAMIWTRLCGQEFPNPVVHERRQKIFRHPIDFDEDQPVEEMDGAVRGISGWVRFHITNEDGQRMTSEWLEARPDVDYAVSHTFENLKAASRYEVEIEGRHSVSDDPVRVAGYFHTAPASDETSEVLLVTSTCQYFWSYDDGERGFQTYDGMSKLEPDLYIQTGDYVYYDKPGPLATNLEKAWHKWNAMDSWPAIRNLYTHVPVFMMKDDHDLLKNDVFPSSGNYGDLSYREGLKIWYSRAPIYRKPYRTIRWGRDLEVWLVEGREYRSANDMEDGLQKSIWGEEQKSWFVDTVEKSDATFKILFTPTPIVGPDRDQKVDNHANATFATEGRWLREYLSGLKNMYVVNGDRHWQYVSRDLETGLMEFGSGPVSDFHAQGWMQEDVRPEHQYLALRGGFLSVRVNRLNEIPYITFRHHDVKGEVLNEVKFGRQN